MSEASVGTSDPFPLTMDPSTYVPSQARERALAQLDAALDAGAVPCLEGPTGIGKTLLLRVFGQRVAPRYTPLYLPFPLLSARELCALALGLLGRKSAGDAEAVLEGVAAECALNGRPLLLLLDDAASLPPESARGLTAILARSRGRLRMALAGIGSEALLRAIEPFGDGLVRIALDEGVADAALPGYVAAQLERAHAPADLRQAFDPGALAEIGRLAAGNPRRLHIAAQTILRRADPAPPARWRTLPPVPLSPADASEASEGLVASATPAPITVPGVPETPREAPAALAQIVAAPTPLSIAPEVAPETPPEVAAAAAEVPAPLPDPPAAPTLATPSESTRPDTDAPSRLAPARPAEGAGEYRYVRAHAPAASGGSDPNREADFEDPILLPPAQIDLTLAPLLEAAQSLAAKSASTDSAATRRTRTDARAEIVARRTPPIVLVPIVAALSAVIGFALASQIERGREGLRAIAARIAPGLFETSEPASAPAQAPTPPVQTPTPIPAPVGAAHARDVPRSATPPVAAKSIAPEVEVSINASPWAQIEIDGWPVGETPLGDIPLPTGVHRFRALYPDGRVSERVVEIDAENRTVVFE